MHNSGQSIKLIIFDFDGVIADSFDAYYRLNKMAMAHVGLRLTKAQYSSLFDANIYAGFASYIGNRQDLIKFSDFKKTGNKLDIYSGVNLFPGIEESIRSLKNRYKLAIASASSADEITKFLKNYGIINYFKLIEGSSQKTKKIMFKNIADKFNVKPSDVLMISDTVGDLLEARELGFKIGAVSWGFQEENKLKSIVPDFYFLRIKELLDLSN